jgi:hypothetical protein
VNLATFIGGPLHGQTLELASLPHEFQTIAPSVNAAPWVSEDPKPTTMAQPIRKHRWKAAGPCRVYGVGVVTVYAYLGES